LRLLRIAHHSRLAGAHEAAAASSPLIGNDR